MLQNVEEKRLMNAYYVASARAKVSSVQDYLETLLDGSGSGDKFLFFAHHKELLDAASAVCCESERRSSFASTAPRRRRCAAAL